MFVKGKSGNPSGRPKRTPEQKEALELARSCSPEGVRLLIQYMRRGFFRDDYTPSNEAQKMAFAATKEILKIGGVSGEQEIDLGVNAQGGIVLLPRVEFEESEAEPEKEEQSE